MIGKKLADIRAELAAKLDTSGRDLSEWFQQRIKKLDGKTKSSERDVANLNKIRDAIASLCDAVEQK